MFVVNTPVYDAFDLLDNSNVAITGKTNSDFTKSAYLVSTPATSATVTVTEIGSGAYQMSFTPTVVGSWKGTIVYNSGGVYRMFSGTYDIVTAQQADPAGTFPQLAGTIVASTAPVALDGTITLYPGSSYAASENRALPWSTTDAGTWPDLTGAAITLSLSNRDFKTAPNLTIVGSVTTPSGAAKAVQVELAASDTSGLIPGAYRYKLTATLTNGHVILLASGIVLLKE